MSPNPFQRLFSAGYRVFFLLAGLSAVLTMIVWEGWLAIHASGGMVTGEPFAMAPHLWHAHELIFGYGSAAVAGFLMTAAPNWTGSKSAPVSFFAATSALWLAGRMAIWWSGGLPPVLTATLDLAFVPVVALRILALLLKRPKPPQMLILGVIVLFWLGNLLVHFEWTGLTDDTASAGLRVGLLTLCALIMTLGGRITPAFTRNAMIRAGREDHLPANPPVLAAASIAAALLVPVTMLFGLPGAVPGALALLAGAAGLARLSMWRGGWTLSQPILWTLHLSYATNSLGFILVGLSLAGIGSEVAALHVAGIGGVGGMTLSVMSRAALGHSGRPLVAPWPVALAYALMPLATLLRYAASAWPGFYFTGVLLAGALWILVYVLYTAALWPVFWGEREDAAGKGAEA
ncbi:NnrS family protein [Tropicimonas sp.]|uniref:NnrS family protein n=1 Tax=Tropicimonas sp. TaxID=2067044 RepID=UPI003A8B5495